MQFLRRFLADASGVMLAEYAIMLGVFCLGCLCAAHYFSREVSAAMNRASDVISLGAGH
jgi:Flp pilus assembly pilin Flp